MTTRREFIKQCAATAAGFTALKFVPGCEHVEINPKVKGFSFDFITKNEDWYHQSGNGNSVKKEEALDVSKDNWQLKVNGPEGETIGKIDYEKLKSLEPVTYIKTMKCVYFTSLVGAVADTYISTGVFKGAPLPAIFEEIGGVPADATEKLRAYAWDGFTSNLTVDRAMQEGPDPLPAMLAYKMNGRPLPKLRGGPVRLVVPEMWGYKNVKWCNKLKFTKDGAAFGEYETNLFDPENDKRIDDPARICLSTLGTNPTKDVELEGPDITVQGVSVSGSATIEEVEFQLDGGEWEKGEIKEAKEIQASVEEPIYSALQEAENFSTKEGGWPQKSVWILWSKELKGLSSGSHKLVLRSKDSEGRVNPPAGEVENPTGPKDSQRRVEVPFKIK